MKNLSKMLFIAGTVATSISSFSHSGNVRQSGKYKGCHSSKSSKTLHCHPERLKGREIKEKAALDTKGKYRRKLYPHWIDRDGDCQNERQEILIGRSLVPVIFKINRKGKSCTVLSGTWRDFYFKELLTEASEIDVYHIVPLKHAHDSGAFSWSRDKRRQFANDPENLVLTNKSYNRQKGAQTPLKWLPVNRSYACRYFKRWLFVKRKYALEITSLELSEFKKMNCKKEQVQDV